MVALQCYLHMNRSNIIAPAKKHCTSSSTSTFLRIITKKARRRKGNGNNLLKQPSKHAYIGTCFAVLDNHIFIHFVHVIIAVMVIIQIFSGYSDVVSVDSSVVDVVVDFDVAIYFQEQTLYFIQLCMCICMLRHETNSATQLYYVIMECDTIYRCVWHGPFINNKLLASSAS
ncbi:hypothetical protein HELRODRAFT_167765 [Helobdella robusta]|uniref:Transmembrane protein n=1 Tax=Helobdella robusta TaxID=6412 RepID=T1EZS1_HELRO|nr:hypothetical protein HELRODRAFT_167765 [Helobdella robusta]ESO09938.1 hypothetical protein HELRODRAFT_167765 [Helobdella robusta]